MYTKHAAYCKCKSMPNMQPDSQFTICFKAQAPYSSAGCILCITYYNSRQSQNNDVECFAKIKQESIVQSGLESRVSRLNCVILIYVFSGSDRGNSARTSGLPDVGSGRSDATCIIWPRFIRVQLYRGMWEIEIMRDSCLNYYVMYILRLGEKFDIAVSDVLGVYSLEGAYYVVYYVLVVINKL